MPLVCWGGEPLTLEDMTQVAAAVSADDLDPLHEHGVILVSYDSAGDGVKVGRPPAATAELVRGLV